MPTSNTVRKEVSWYFPFTHRSQTPAYSEAWMLGGYLLTQGSEQNSLTQAHTAA